MEEQKKRILCIDGGGIKGAFPASFLAALEEHTQHPIGHYFDLIVGTSTGAIIGGGLATGLSAKQILGFYEREGPSIFSDQGSLLRRMASRAARTVKWAVAPKYNSANLRAALDEALGDKLIGHARTRLVIPAWNPKERRVYIYKTAHHPRLAVDYTKRVVDAVMASASAPTYFRQHVSASDVGLIDGGVWANNPIAVAVVEAIAMLGWEATELDVLSLGCIDDLYDISPNAGLGSMSLKSIKLFMDGQKFGAMGMARLLTGDGHEREAIHRVDHTARAGLYKMDDTSKISELKGIGFSLARERLPKMKAVFLGSPAEQFTPCHELPAEDQA